MIGVYMTHSIIVTYNPDIDRLSKNIGIVIKQVNKIIIVDNNSSNINEIENLVSREEYSEYGHITLIENAENRGLAYALNEGFKIAITESANWVLTLDQDSLVPDDYIKLCSRYFDIPEIGIITCGYFEEGSGISVKNENAKSYFTFVKRSITSAAVVRIEAYLKCGGYDNNLFTDYVDFDFSIRVRNKGYYILYMNDVLFSHQLGDSRAVNFLFWKFRYSSHSVKRERLIARSIVIFAKKYKEGIIFDYLSLGKHLFCILFYDSEKFNKIKSLILGISDGCKYNKSMRLI